MTPFVSVYPLPTNSLDQAHTRHPLSSLLQSVSYPSFSVTVTILVLASQDTVAPKELATKLTSIFALSASVNGMTLGIRDRLRDVTPELTDPSPCQ